MEKKDKFGIKFEMINGSQKGVQNESWQCEERSFV